MGNTFCCKNGWNSGLNADKLKMLAELDYSADHSEMDIEDQRNSVGKTSGKSSIVFKANSINKSSMDYFLNESDRSILHMQMMLDEIRSAKEAVQGEDNVSE